MPADAPTKQELREFREHQRLSDGPQTRPGLQDSVEMLSRETSPLSYEVIGAAMEVHRELGPGFLEAVYHEALSKELLRRGIAHASEVPLPVFYKGEPLAARYRADLVVDGRLLLELKAIALLTRIEEAQVIHYLRATGLAAGILLNFGSNSLQVRRLGNRRAAGTVAQEFP